MSTGELRSLSGPGTIVAKTPSFAERFVATGLHLPDQAQMKLMMRATAVGAAWSAKLTQIAHEERFQVRPVPFTIYSLGEYADVPQNKMGSPMPAEVANHIGEVKRHFPEADVKLRAHPYDDPFVEVTLDSEPLLTMAWRRTLGILEIFPK